MPGSPELSNVAWFLSLVVMLLVVLRQKAQNEGGEYKRGAKSPKVSLKDGIAAGIAWQAWVSDQARYPGTIKMVRDRFASFCMISDEM